MPGKGIRVLVGLGLVLALGSARADEKPKGDTLDDIVNQPPPVEETQPAATQAGSPGTRSPSAQGSSQPDAAVQQQEAEPPPPEPAPVAKPRIDVKPATTDVTAVAKPPSLLAPVAAPSVPRAPGPFDLGAVDCRVLDASGIERVLPKRLLFGAEPDLLCRVQVTQPPTVSSANHMLVMTVYVGSRATYQQKRAVHLGAMGRKSFVFVVPSDVMVSDEPKAVTVRVQLSAPATPKLRDVRIPVETED